MKKKTKIIWHPYMTHKGCDCLTPIPPTGLVGGSRCQKHNNPTDKYVRLK